MIHSSRALAILLTLSLQLGCAHTLIPGADIEDTADNRQILDILKTFKTALQDQNTETLISLVSESYFEDMGTADPGDDYGYEHLRDVIIPTSMKVVGKVMADFIIHEIIVDQDKAHADIRYTTRSRLDLPTGPLWETHREFNRVEFQLEEGRWLITRGL